MVITIAAQSASNNQVQVSNDNMDDNSDKKSDIS